MECGSGEERATGAWRRRRVRQYRRQARVRLAAGWRWRPARRIQRLRQAGGGGGGRCSRWRHGGNCGGINGRCLASASPWTYLATVTGGGPSGEAPAPTTASQADVDASAGVPATTIWEELSQTLSRTSLQRHSTAVHQHQRGLVLCPLFSFRRVLSLGWWCRT